MELTSLLQARCAFACLFAGLLVALSQLPLDEQYATMMPAGHALVYGMLAGIVGTVFSASIFAALFDDRFWEHVFTAVPAALVVGLAIMFLELLIPIFVFQGLLYAILGAVLGAIFGFWLHLLLCRCRLEGRCGCGRREG